MLKKIILLLCFALISTTCLCAQTIAFSGQVTDSLNNPLEYANLLAVPKADQVAV
ncbi:hypothetical protein [uncultured Formosa sp.]|uniref:hypothetical protein n=1 Tax=uncultured Formosa sp. TaxID=255435 RepID=UPI00261C27F1|nr:hypothetical protein [uncultured Formosa sp.]